MQMCLSTFLKFVSCNTTRDQSSAQTVLSLSGLGPRPVPSSLYQM